MFVKNQDIGVGPMLVLTDILSRYLNFITFQNFHQAQLVK